MRPPLLLLYNLSHGLTSTTTIVASSSLMASDRVDFVDDVIDLEYESRGSKCETESERDQEQVSDSQLLQGKRSKV
ncbi:hypothetical protein C1H46_039973 [Malus baccata]|uniref:Uncharacterized protein n=1 Tax=Malus baccata TaxID=106549 RepID=A0A540KJV0_MALBA|nr:hypothetical protein C1H46_039973 [Malus baccata]